MMTRRLSIRVDSPKSKMLVKTSLWPQNSTQPPPRRTVVQGATSLVARAPGEEPSYHGCDFFYSGRCHYKNDYCETNDTSKPKIKVRIIDIG